MNEYKVVSRDAGKIEVRAVTQTTTHKIVDAMAYDDVIPQWAADQIRQQQVSAMMQRGETLTVQLTSASGSAPPPLPSKQRDERKEKMMAKRLMDTLVKQYAPDADTAWAWMRQAHEIEQRIVPVARCCGSSGDSGEPYPGWKLVGEGVWAKGSYVVAGGPPFLLTKKVSVFQDEIVFETLAEYPTLEAAVMRAELADDLHSDDDAFNLAMLHSAARFLNGR